MGFSKGAFRSLACGTIFLSLLNLHVVIASGQGAPAPSRNASLTIIVFDQSGAVIPNADIALAGENTVTTKTGPDGSSQVPLSYGNYTVTVRSPGFKASRINGLTVDAAKPPVLRVVLEVGHYSGPTWTGGENLVPTIRSDVPNVLVPRSTKDEIQLRAKVNAVVPLEDFSGRAFPVDIDPHFALTVRIVSAVPAVTDLNPGAVVTFAIHSPTIVFAGDSPKRKTYNFSLCRETGDDKVKFSRLGIQTSHGVRVGGCG